MGISPLIRGPMNRALEYITIQSRGASASLHQRVSDAQIAMGLGKDRFISYLRVNLDRVPPLVRGRMNSLQSVPGVAWSRVTSLSSQITAANVMIRTSRVSYPSAKEVRAWSGEGPAVHKEPIHTGDRSCAKFSTNNPQQHSKRLAEWSDSDEEFRDASPIVS
jgi:hypothetical protein